ncbi:MAG: HAMP domain-containing histidine kinase [Myxococcales bacterium]|nr:MAG: HAMP domain-containing histidine kinase [Myxococcales bacterium]
MRVAGERRTAAEGPDLRCTPRSRQNPHTMCGGRGPAHSLARDDGLWLMAPLPRRLDCAAMTTESPHHAEREQTDESLRVEREKADQAVEGHLSTVEERADAIVNQARERADRLLAATRARTDRLPPSGGAQAGAEVLRRERRAEDRLLQEERDTADEALRGERAEHAALLASERDETDRDLLAERARSDDTLAMRDEFLGIVSHDLRNMLTGIVGFAGLIATDLTEQRPVAPSIRHAGRIERSAARMNRLIGDLVDIASIEAGRLAVAREPGDPAAVVTEVVEFFQVQAAAASIALVARVIPPTSLAVFDTARIVQVLTNLISNALKFTPAGGRVIVQVERRGDDMHFAVSDTGVGLPADRLEAVFGRFVQVADNDRRGVGLGLYISKCIVQGHEGRIWVESAPGQGSTFHVTLPVHPAG